MATFDHTKIDSLEIAARMHDALHDYLSEHFTGDEWDAAMEAVWDNGWYDEIGELIHRALLKNSPEYKAECDRLE